MAIKVNEQLSLWDSHREGREKAKGLENRFGPFQVQESETSEDVSLIKRNFECSNYDKCLSFASKNLWGSFTCEGCRKTGRVLMGLNKIFAEVH